MLNSNYTTLDNSELICKFTHFRNAKDSIPIESEKIWADVVSSFTIFCEPSSEDSKKMFPAWCPTLYKDKNRTIESAVEINSLIGLDFDEDITLDELETLTTGLECIIHTSFKNSPDNQRFRVILPISKSIPAGNWLDVWLRLNQWSGFKLDKATKNVNRIFFYPQTQSQFRHLSFSKHYEGAIFDPYRLPEAPERVQTVETSSSPKKPVRSHLNAKEIDFNDVEWKSYDEHRLEAIFDEKWTAIKAESATIDGSVFDYRVLVTMSNMKVHPQQMKAAFDVDGHQGHYRKLVNTGKIDTAVDYLNRSYLKALSQPNREGFDEARHSIEINASMIRDFVQNHYEWKGIRGRNLLKVLQAHITKFEMCGLDEYQLSMREASELSKIGKNTVSSLNRELIKNGWIEVVKKSNKIKSESTTFKFGLTLKTLLYMIGVSVGDTKTHKSNVCICPDRLTPIAHDSSMLFKSNMVVGQTDTYGVFERAGLGSTAERIWIELQSRPLTISEIVTTTGIHKVTVSKLVAKLEELSIVTTRKNFKNMKVVTVDKNYDFKTLAENLRTIDIAAKRHQKHQLERHLHRNHMKALREMNQSSHDS